MRRDPCLRIQRYVSECRPTIAKATACTWIPATFNVPLMIAFPVIFTDSRAYEPDTILARVAALPFSCELLVTADCKQTTSTCVAKRSVVATICRVDCVAYVDVAVVLILIA